MSGKYTLRNYLFGQQMTTRQQHQRANQEMAATQRDFHDRGWARDHHLQQESLVYGIGGLVGSHIVAEMLGHVFLDATNSTDENHWHNHGY
jgi:hypothetical protein